MKSLKAINHRQKQIKIQRVLGQKWLTRNRALRRTRRKSSSRVPTSQDVEKVHIKTIPKKAFLYVSRISKETRVDTLCDYLKTSFPEVKCEQLENKFESAFTRYKVTIDYCNLDKSKDPAVWPKGVEVGRFFHPRKRENAAT
ncbi:hypothetical protein Zmor_023851 [Zophobas morio]|uniref:Uncharacterized protein n=1 Tax=Zophobas morio TaxID=2755281 RepID=A0AA38I1Y9_9CUCU|nr:hypothetical protein Zmor_023851 [Zophobas morio]